MLGNWHGIVFLFCKNLKAGSAVFLSLFLVSACASINYDVPRLTSNAEPVSQETDLGKFSIDWSERHGHMSGFYPLADGKDALAVRMHLAARAEHSIDMQYFLMKPDTSAAMITQSLLDAADRGVKVRILIDDIFTKVSDNSLMSLDQHPNVQVRVFNPIPRAGFYWLNYLATFEQTNGRMHQKSFTVDNAFTIVGGRNIADEYYSLPKRGIFYDFDLLAVGPIAEETSDSFDTFWNFERALPAEYLRNRIPKNPLTSLRNTIVETIETEDQHNFSEIYDSPVLRELFQQNFIPGNARLISDAPDKITRKRTPDTLIVANSLKPVLEAAEKKVVFISPYFIPDDVGLELLQSLTDRGVRVVIVTNSLASNNHTSAQSAYIQKRKAILRTGVELYELRAHPHPTVAEGISQGNTDEGTLTMHVKLMLIDDEKVFGGSLNLDARSVVINTEMGLLVDSAPLVGFMMADFEQMLVNSTYRLRLNENNRTEWVETVNGTLETHTNEPQTNWLKRMQMHVLKIVPDSQL